MKDIKKTWGKEKGGEQGGESGEVHEDCFFKVSDCSMTFQSYKKIKLLFSNFYASAKMSFYQRFSLGNIYIISLKIEDIYNSIYLN